jgi:transposase
MSKEFRPWKIDEAQLLPPSVQDYVPQDHVSRLIVSLVKESLDLSAILGSYRSGLGQPPFDPRMMTALLLHGYASGIYSSRRIARATVERADFMMIVAGDPPDFRTISEFRRRHLKALADLFVQVLKLAEKAGLVKLGHVALDGTKIKANASKHKAMSYDRMKKREAELEAEVDRWLKAAEAADAEEDKRYGDQRGDEMPDWVADKQKRLEKIREAKAALEAEAKAAAEVARKARAEAEERRRRRQEVRQDADENGARRQGATQFHRPGEPHTKDQGRLHPGLQRTGRGRWCPSDHRGADADQFLQRSGATGAVARRDQGQFGDQSRRSVGRRRLLLRRQSSHDQAAAHRGLHRHRKAEARHQVRHREKGFKCRLADRQDEHQAQARRLPKSLPLA